MIGSESDLRFEGHGRSRPVVNIAPLIDIVFLLLVFFMLTTSFLERESVILHLPAPAAASPKNQPVMVRVSIDGSLRSGGQALSPAQLGALAIAELAADPARGFYIESDRETPVQATLDAMDILRGAGVKNLRFSARADYRP